MKIITGYPPNIENIKMVFPVTEHTIYAYGDIIYSPQGDQIRPDLIYHENVHREQQAGNPEAWWGRYLTDVDFRLSQEIEAYAKQVEFVRKHTTSKIAKDCLEDCARQLASPLYSLGLDYYQIETMIRKYRGIDKS
jgi:hypothetical protein